MGRPAPGLLVEIGQPVGIDPGGKLVREVEARPLGGGEVAGGRDREGSGGIPVDDLEGGNPEVPSGPQHRRRAHAEAASQHRERVVGDPADGGEGEEEQREQEADRKQIPGLSRHAARFPPAGEL